ncbi:hypothetical protein Glove_541g64 [Diversispora epigaea]|uniref:Uncharacterized protein n=1 Tax=Diversispora epigaea TaxID=1348612 RepID=A0A397GCV6_9GLOM|nr:hypothetical protein Glove_541g64 [Diversispora epigaea]
MEKRIVMPAKDIRKMHQIINEERNENILYKNFRIDEDMEFNGITFIDAKQKFLESKFISEKTTVDKLVKISNQLRYLNNITHQLLVPKTFIFINKTHLLTFIKGVMRGAIPGWYNDLETLYNTPTIQNKVIGMKEFHNFINLFIDMCSPFKTKDGVWYSQRNKGQYNIGKLTREKSLEDVLVDDYITQHFVQVSRGLEPTSIVRPCKMSDQH